MGKKGGGSEYNIYSLLKPLCFANTSSVTRIYASLGLCMKFKTLFMSNE